MRRLRVKSIHGVKGLSKPFVRVVRTLKRLRFKSSVKLERAGASVETCICNRL